MLPIHWASAGPTSSSWNEPSTPVADRVQRVENAWPLESIDRALGTGRAHEQIGIIERPTD